MSTYVLVKLTVEEFGKWKTGFEAAAALRKSAGSLGVHAFSKSDNPNEVIILGEYEDMEKARQMFQSQEFRDATKKAGVMGAPEVTYMNEAVKLPA